jgi:hypothetical protein
MNRRFAIGFTIGLLAFVLINLFSAHLSSDCGLIAVFERDLCTDEIARAGWPFRFYERGGFNYRFEFHLPILLLDLVMGTILAAVLGWLIAHTRFAPD